MHIKKLKKLWNAVKKDAKKHPEKYKRKYLSLWQIGEIKRLKRELDNGIIIKSRCEECNGKGKMLVAFGYAVTKNNRNYSKVKKEWVKCEDCDGAGFKWKFKPINLRFKFDSKNETKYS